MVAGVQESKVRLPAAAGKFYPADAGKLREMVDGFLRAAREGRRGQGAPRALLVPHAGYLYSGPTAALAYFRLKPLQSSRPHFVLIGPSHYFSFSKIASAAALVWQTPLGAVRHRPASALARAAAVFSLNEEVHLREHALEVQLPFLQRLFGRGFSVTCLLTSRPDFDLEAAAARLGAHYASAVFVFSSDLSHYLPLPRARERDGQTLRALAAGDAAHLLREENAACGAVGLALAAVMAHQRGWKFEVLGYDTSAAASGDFSSVVGYAAGVWTEGG